MSDWSTPRCIPIDTSFTRRIGTRERALVFVYLRRFVQPPICISGELISMRCANLPTCAYIAPRGANFQSLSCALIKLNLFILKWKKKYIRFGIIKHYKAVRFQVENKRLCAIYNVDDKIYSYPLKIYQGSQSFRMYINSIWIAVLNNLVSWVSLQYMYMIYRYFISLS